MTPRIGILWVGFTVFAIFPFACSDDDSSDDGASPAAGEGGENSERGGSSGSSGTSGEGGTITGGTAGSAGTRGGTSGASGSGGAGGSAGDGEPGGMAGEGGRSDGGDGGLGGAGGVAQACSPHDLDSSIDIPTEVDAAPCAEVYLSDICPTYEYNIHFCLTFDTVYWQPDMVVDRMTIAKGLGMHPPHPSDANNPSCRFLRTQTVPAGRGAAAWNLAGYDRFQATVALAENMGEEVTIGANGVTFVAYVDGNVRFQSGLIEHTSTPQNVMIDTTGGSLLVLEVDSLGGNHSDSAVWANARFRRTCP